MNSLIREWKVYVYNEGKIVNKDSPIALLVTVANAWQPMRKSSSEFLTRQWTNSPGRSGLT